MNPRPENPGASEPAAARWADPQTQQPGGESAPARGEAWPAEATQWQRVSRRYAVVDLLFNLLWAVGIALVFAVLWVVTDGEISLLALAGGAVLVLISLVSAVLAFRRVRAIGYFLREDDLLFRRGILFERVIAVPYGRLQLVDITRGPIMRALGLATLKFVTASAATGVNLPGLTVADAEQLRDRLVSLAETRRSGL